MNAAPKNIVLSRLGTAAKLIIPIVIFAWLLQSLDREQLSALRARDIHWPLMGAAFVLVFLSISLTFVRWYYLVRALEIPFRLRDAFRLGFLGYFCNFVSVGSVGGDLFKAFFIAREQPGRRTLAVASVLVDRIMGVYALVIVTAVAILLGGIPRPTLELQAIETTIYGAAIVGTLGLVVMFLPGFTSGPLAEMVCGWPKIGGLMSRIIEAVRCYRRQGFRLAALGLLSMSVHILLAISVYFIADALYDLPPTLVEHIVIVNLSGAVGALPFTPAGLGTYELAMATLYQIVPRQAVASGIIVAFTYRLLTIAIAGVGVVVYWMSRREMAQVQAALEAAEARLEEDAATSR